MTQTTSNTDAAMTSGMGRWSNDDEWLTADFSLTETAVGIRLTDDGPTWSWVAFDVIAAVDQLGNDEEGRPIVEFFSADGLVMAIRTPREFLDDSIDRLVESRQGRESNVSDVEPATHSELESVRAAISSLSAEAGGAITTTEYWVVNGSRAEGDKVLQEMSRLVLRMYDTEAVQLVRELAASGSESAGLDSAELDSSISRLDQLRDSISELGRAMELAIANGYHQLRCDELRLVSRHDVSAAPVGLSSVVPHEPDGGTAG